MPLRREQGRAIRQALMSAYANDAALRIFLMDALGQELNRISQGGTYEVVVFDLIEWAQSEGRLDELVAAALRDKPGNAELRALSSPTGQSSAAGGAPPEPTPSVPVPAQAAAVPYLDFHLLLEREDDRYRARVVSSPAGTTSAVKFRSPVRPEELGTFRLSIHKPLFEQEGPEHAVQRVRALGRKLYRAAFRGEVETCLARSEQEASGRGAGLRIRIHVDAEAPELAELPWEFLYDERADRFLCLSKFSSIVRFLDINAAPPPQRVEGRLRALVVIASPADYPELRVEDEWTRVRTALEGLGTRLDVELLQPATLDALEQALQRGRYHLIHFVGHSGFDPGTGEGVVVLQGPGGKGYHLLSGERLGILAQDHRSLRLVVLNSCEGTRASERDAFAGVAQGLIRRGLPAVLGMQFEITDNAAIRFSQIFYASVVAGDPVDTAVAQGRQALYVRGGDGTIGPLEWGTPALFMLVPEGRVFDVAGA